MGGWPARLHQAAKIFMQRRDAFWGGGGAHLELEPELVGLDGLLEVGQQALVDVLAQTLQVALDHDDDNLACAVCAVVQVVVLFHRPMPTAHHTTACHPHIPV